MALLLIVTLTGTSILQYIGTFDAKARSGLVYDCSPPSRGKLLRSHNDNRHFFGSGRSRNAGHNISCVVGRRRAYGVGRKSGLDLFRYFLWKYQTKVGEFLKSSAGSKVISS